MLKLLIHSALALALLASGAFASQAAAASAERAHWLNSYDEATAVARRTGRPILADFTGSDWCGWCKALKREVFATDTFTAWAKDHVVLLELDFPQHIPQSPELTAQNRQLMQHYGVDGFPTILILDADGKKLGQLGYQEGGPVPWIAEFTRQQRAARQ